MHATIYISRYTFGKFLECYVIRCFLPPLIIHIVFANIGGMASFVIYGFGCD